VAPTNFGLQYITLYPQRKDDSAKPVANPFAIPESNKTFLRELMETERPKASPKSPNIDLEVPSFLKREAESSMPVKLFQQRNPSNDAKLDKATLLQNLEKDHRAYLQRTGRVTQYQLKPKQPLAPSPPPRTPQMKEFRTMEEQFRWDRAVQETLTLCKEALVREGVAPGTTGKSKIIAIDLEEEKGDLIFANGYEDQQLAETCVDIMTGMEENPMEIEPVYLEKRRLDIHTQHREANDYEQWSIHYEDLSEEFLGFLGKSSCIIVHVDCI
jgi:hypothetical protein